jgi:hypothetical protein
VTTKTYRVINTGYVSPRTVWTLESAVRFAYEMCNVAEASSIIVDPETGKTLGGCDIDPEFGTSVSWLNSDAV